MGTRLAPPSKSVRFGSKRSNSGSKDVKTWTESNGEGGRRHVKETYKRIVQEKHMNNKVHSQDASGKTRTRSASASKSLPTRGSYTGDVSKQVLASTHRPSHSGSRSYKSSTVTPSRTRRSSTGGYDYGTCTSTRRTKTPSYGKRVSFTNVSPPMSKSKSKSRSSRPQSRSRSAGKIKTKIIEVGDNGRTTTKVVYVDKPGTERVVEKEKVVYVDRDGGEDIEEEIHEVHGNDGNIKVQTSGCCWWMTIAAIILAVILVFVLIFAVIGGGSSGTVAVVGASTGSAHVVGVAPQQEQLVINNNITVDGKAYGTQRVVRNMRRLMMRLQ